MGKKIIFDKTLIGQKFNSLTIIDIDLQVGVRKRIICKCECGNIIRGHYRDIVSGKLKSCGCLKKEPLNKYKKMVGKKINKWLILSFNENSKNNTFTCQCECGTIKEVNVNNLCNNKSKDCGCGRKNTLSKLKSKNLIGMRFGKLVAIEKLPYSNKFNRVLYKCKCDCGREVIVPSQSLIRHHTVSCGCIISYYNMIIGNYLTELNILHTSEYTIKIENTYFRFDFYLPTYNLMIEYDGEQHFMPVKYYNCSDDDAVKKFEKTKNSDQIKNKYCIDNGIELLRIPYYEKNNIKPIIDMCLQRLSEKASV